MIFTFRSVSFWSARPCHREHRQGRAEKLFWNGWLAPSACVLGWVGPGCVERSGHWPWICYSWWSQGQCSRAVIAEDGRNSHRCISTGVAGATKPLGGFLSLVFGQLNVLFRSLLYRPVAALLTPPAYPWLRLALLRPRWLCWERQSSSVFDKLEWLKSERVTGRKQVHFPFGQVLCVLHLLYATSDTSFKKS